MEDKASQAATPDSVDRGVARAGAESGDKPISAGPENTGANGEVKEHEDAYPAMTMEDVLEAERSEGLPHQNIHRGMLVKGAVVLIGSEGVMVDIGAKLEGLIPFSQLSHRPLTPEEAQTFLKVGDEVLVYVVRADISNGVIILSKKRADQERSWHLIQEVFEKEHDIEVEIIEKVRGGLVADMGVRAFLPASQVDVRRVNDLSPYVGRKLKCRIIELNRRRNRVIISRRAVLEKEIAALKSETMKALEPGAVMEGEVVEITDFGAFVALGGIDGLVHRSELTWGRFNHPREAVQVGLKVRVKVLDMDLERERINLSIKSLIPDPWLTMMDRYQIGQRVSGKVTNLTNFGAFVEVEPGLEGLIHVSEMSWTKRIKHPTEILKDGDEVEAVILRVDPGDRRLSLGLRQTQPDPWSTLPDRFPPGTRITGKVTGITEFGVFMEITDGIEGLIHISELAHERVEDPHTIVKKGDEVEAVVINIDPIEQRASLSRKRLQPITADTFSGADYSYTPSADREHGGGRPAGGSGRAGRSEAGKPGKRKKGGRRGVDYDYDYTPMDSGGAASSAKLGDVYADLFAQFGLDEGKEERATAPAAPALSTPGASGVEQPPAEGERVESPATPQRDDAPKEAVAAADESHAELQDEPRDKPRAELEDEPQPEPEPVAEGEPEEEQKPAKEREADA